jgi:hypothetical protein
MLDRRGGVHIDGVLTMQWRDQLGQRMPDTDAIKPAAEEAIAGVNYECDLGVSPSLRSTDVE